MKCIVIETSPERISAKPVTNEDGTPHVYATISEARAELKANGYSYNRANARYYFADAPEYRAYILREDSEEYAEIIEQAEQQAAPEYIGPEHIQNVSGNKIYRSTDPVTGWNVFTVAGRDFWELAEARYFAQCNPAEDPEQETAAAARIAAASVVDAYAKTEGISPADVTPEQSKAAYAVAAAEIIGTDKGATPEQRATVAAMVEAIADAARKDAAFSANQAANDAITDANRAYEEIGDWRAFFIELAEKSAAKAARIAVVANDKATTAKAAAVSAMIRRVREDLEEPAPVYQRYELLAYLGEPEDYDVDAIEAEATTFTADGARVWSAFGDDLAAIAERHEIATYYPAAI